MIISAHETIKIQIDTTLQRKFPSFYKTLDDPGLILITYTMASYSFKRLGYTAIALT